MRGAPSARRRRPWAGTNASGWRDAGLLGLSLLGLVVLGWGMGVVVVHVWAATVRSGVDVPLNRYFFHHRDRHLTALLRLVSLAGEESVTLAATVVAGLAWGRWRRSWLPFPALAVAFGGGTVIAAAVKVAVGRGRPAGAPFLALSHLGFPSGHATVAAALYGTWAVLIARSPIRPRVRAVSVAGLAALALAVAFSRLSLGRHDLTEWWPDWSGRHLGLVGQRRGAPETPCATVSRVGSPPAAPVCLLLCRDAISSTTLTKLQ